MPKRNSPSSGRESDPDSGKNDHVSSDHRPSEAKRGRVAQSRTGGVYIPPFKLSRLQREVQEDDSQEYQRQEWDKLKKHINGVVNKLTSTNIPDLIGELLECNVIRGRGLLARTWIRAQMASPGFTPIYASFLAIVNSKFPEVGELVVRRILLQFRRAYKRNDRIVCQSCVKCIAHLVNQKIAHEVMALQLLAVLLTNPTDDSVELSVSFITEVGASLQESCKQGLEGIFEHLKTILQSGDVEKRTQYSIEKLWTLRRNKFADFPPIQEGLDLVEQGDQITHDIDFLDDNITADEGLNIFRFVPPEVYRAENTKWKDIKNTLLGIDGEDDAESDSSEDSEASQEDSDQDEYTKTEESGKTLKILDSTEQDLINLRKTLYLCIMSSLNYEECVHKLLKLNIEPGREIEVCTMLIDCCAMERTFQQFYALQAERLSKIHPQYNLCFQECFAKQYQLSHRLETPKLRNIARFFTHLLYSDAIPWTVLSIIQLSEEATTSSGRIFIKIIFQELCHHMGLQQLDRKFHDPDLLPHLSGIFPSEHPKNIRFAINFFTAIGLGAITDRLRKLL
ncbi:cell cycle control protein, putative [Theileria equi strain WA]|uniref:Cell cycle control protein, putative n=1 Tax=Theileria equi strain WA TaxID=1537102 RepID=L1LGH6_THEEQ|nr:cell cycle control protein, putative [Theileria equi strain WA]EKX74374.1 cell cycle control protein, putative [Theileria equi strain WA]|eukprot:XP_004833826.1 cell cycle control protein, putative [Theileria equi strain WA]